MLLLCGGKVTEPEYFRGLARDTRNAAVHIKVIPSTSNPAQLVDKAISRLEDDQFDQVWCVFDVDDYAHQVAQALTRADRYSAVRLAISNPCFELWLLLHFEDWASAAEKCRALRSALRKHLPNYDKSVDFRHYRDSVQAAIERARNLDDVQCSNPSTGVWRLVQQIKG